MRQDLKRDAQTFFLCVLALAGAFVAGAPVKVLVRWAAEGSAGAALVSRIGFDPSLSDKTLGAIHFFFVMVPALVAFFAIGLPVLLAFSVGAIRHGWPRREAWTLACVLTALGTLMAVRHSSASFLASILAVVALALFGSWSRLRARGSLLGFRVLAAAGIAFAGLAYYEYQLLDAGTQSRTVAPTLLVFGVLGLVAGLPLITIGEFGRGLGRQFQVLAIWATAGLWATIPFSRGWATSPESADWLELRTTALLGLVLTAAEFVDGRRRRAGALADRVERESDEPSPS